MEFSTTNFPQSTQQNHQNKFNHTTENQSSSGQMKLRPRPRSIQFNPKTKTQMGIFTAFTTQASIKPREISKTTIKDCKTNPNFENPPRNLSEETTGNVIDPKFKTGKPLRLKDSTTEKSFIRKSNLKKKINTDPERNLKNDTIPEYTHRYEYPKIPDYHIPNTQFTINTPNSTKPINNSPKKTLILLSKKRKPRSENERGKKIGLNSRILIKRG